MELTRRQFVIGTTVAVSGSVAAASVTSSRRSARAYEAATRELWRTPQPISSAATEVQRALIRGATLAPSSHNTQCWRFHLEPDAITILPDLARRCPAVDPDDHHLHVSLGCAAENMVQTARAYGLHAEHTPIADSANGHRFALQQTTATRTALFDAIPHRQSTRHDFDGRSISTAELALLEQAGRGATSRVILITDGKARESMLELVVAANSLQMQDRAFVAELKDWIRFSASESLSLRDGLFSGASGSPSIPRWIASPLFGALFTTKGENAKYTSQIRTSAGVAVFVSDASDPAHWFETGRAYERFALQCAALDIRTAMINQPVEVATVRPQLATHLGLGALRPDLVVRFGRGTRTPQSLRRPIDAVLV